MTKKSKTKATQGAAFSHIARVLDRLADRHGITAAAVLDRPALLAGTGLEVGDIDSATAREATMLHKQKMAEIVQKFQVAGYAVTLA